MECSFGMGTRQRFRGQKVSSNTETGEHYSGPGTHKNAPHIRRKLRMADVSTRKIKYQTGRHSLNIISQSEKRPRTSTDAPNRFDLSLILRLLKLNLTWRFKGSSL
jgi:hypothetical protein